MFEIIRRPEIEKALLDIDLPGVIERGFVALSQGKAIAPPVSELRLPRGEVHIKSGYIAGDAHFVVKLATGFYGNPARGLASSNGLMLVFDSETGTPAALLLDEGHLTDVRTAVAGAIAAKYLAPSSVSAIGIIGTGTQARLQAEHLALSTTAKQILVYGRNPLHVAAYKSELEKKGFNVRPCNSPGEVAHGARLIVTATPSTQPLLQADDVMPGTHITAVGADSTDKNELDPALFAKANIVVADSKSQCLTQGEIHHAVRAGSLDATKIRELGSIISKSVAGRTSEQEISIADLTGVAVQDIAIALAVWRTVKGKR